MVNKYGQRIFYLLQAGGFFILVAIFIYNRNNRSLGHQHTGNGNACVKNTAGIAAQIKHQSLHALLFQLCIFFGKVITGIFIKYGYSDITDFCIRQKLAADRRIFDFATLNAYSTQFTILALELQFDNSAMLTADFVGYLLHVHITRRFTVNRSNNIAALNTSLRAGIILQSRNNYIVVTAFAKNNTDTAKAAPCHFTQLLKILTVKIDCVRIACRFYHTFYCAVKQLVIIYLAIIVTL